MNKQELKALSAWLFYLGVFLLILTAALAIPLIGHPHLYYNRAFGLVEGACSAAMMFAGIAIRMSL
jgi:hypothetical protein